MSREISSWGIKAKLSINPSQVQWKWNGNWCHKKYFSGRSRRRTWRECRTYRTQSHQVMLACGREYCAECLLLTLFICRQSGKFWTSLWCLQICGDRDRGWEEKNKISRRQLVRFPNCHSKWVGEPDSRRQNGRYSGKKTFWENLKMRQNDRYSGEDARTSPERPSTITELTEHSSTATELLSRGCKLVQTSRNRWFVKNLYLCFKA